MPLIFTKGSGKHDHLEVLRDGRVSERIECPKQGIIPHDMVHVAVETTLQARGGFIGRVLAGEAASFQMAAQADSDGVERLVEVLQADGWSGWQTPAAELIELYQLTCAARHCAPLPVQPADLEAARQLMLALSARWQALAPGQSLTLDLEPDAIERRA